MSAIDPNGDSQTQDEAAAAAAAAAANLNERNDDRSGNGPPGLVWEETNCMLCGSSISKKILQASNLIYNRIGRIQVVRCRDCGHYYQNPRPTRETIGLYYDADYGPHVDRSKESCETPDAAQARSALSTPAAPPTRSAASAPTRRPWYLSKLARAIPGLRGLYYWLADQYGVIIPEPPSPSARALEIGCGRGSFLSELQRQGWHVEGIEPGDNAAEQARARGLPVSTGTFESFQLKAAEYDAVVAWHVIEHLHDPNVALREIRRLLRPTGQLLFSVPNFGCWERWVFGRYHLIVNEPTHLQQFTPRSLRRLLEQNGFRVVAMHGQQNMFNVAGSLGIWLKAIPFGKSIGRRLLNFADNPSLWGQLALAPLAKFLAWIGQAGRLTIVAVPDESWTGQPLEAMADRQSAAT